MTDSAIRPTKPRESGFAFRAQVDELDAEVAHLGALCCETVPRGTTALLTGDFELAQRLIDDDDVIDDLTVAIEDRCLTILARHAPKASELRRIVTVMWLAHELERSADLMTNVAKSARRMLGRQLNPEIRGHLAAMGSEANRLLRLSVDAYADSDVALASALGDIDDRLDELNREIIGLIFEAQAADRIDLTAAVQLALIARYYERVGDHAVNIGERVRYMVTGWSPEHTGAIRHRHRNGPGQTGR